MLSFAKLNKNFNITKLLIVFLYKYLNLYFKLKKKHTLKRVCFMIYLSPKMFNRF